jgi:hypothetical protein
MGQGYYSLRGKISCKFLVAAKWFGIMEMARIRVPAAGEKRRAGGLTRNSEKPLNGEC